MKTVSLVFTCSLFCLAAATQPRGENPKYNKDINPYEKILQDTARGKRTAKFLMNFLEPEVATSYFESSPCNDYVELGNTRIKQFQDFVQSFLSGASDPKQMKTAEANFQKNGVSKIAERIDYHIGYIEKQGTFASNANEPLENLLCRAKGSVQSIKSSQAYLTALKKIFPATPGIDDATKKASDAMAKYGDNKALLSVIKSNKNGALAEVYMPKAVIQNEEWEGWFKTYFTRNYPGYTITRQSLLSAGWFVKKNEISGLTEYRQMGTAIGAKAPDGKCMIIKIDLYQDWLGGRFDNSRFKEYTREDILCENLK